MIIKLNFFWRRTINTQIFTIQGENIMIGPVKTYCALETSLSTLLHSFMLNIKCENDKNLKERQDKEEHGGSPLKDTTL